jgi:hypothetical protein
MKIFLKWKLLRTRLYLEHLSPKAFHLPITIFLFLVAGLIFSYQVYENVDVWARYASATGNAAHFCEMNRMDEIVRQPANTWSNLGYFVVALIVLTLGIQDLKQGEKRKESGNFLVQYPVFSIMFGLCALYLFVGSFLYHASLKAPFQKMDQTAMYFLVITIFTFNLYKSTPLVKVLGKWRSSHGYSVGVAMVLNAVIFGWLWRMNINVLFPALIAMLAISTMYYLYYKSASRYFTNYIVASAFCMLIGFSIWMLDRTHTMCSPESVFQGHAAWHLFTAASMLLVYMYYRSGTLVATTDEN